MVRDRTSRVCNASALRRPLEKLDGVWVDGLTSTGILVPSHTFAPIPLLSGEHHFRELLISDDNIKHRAGGLPMDQEGWT